jgi:ankyrin repeat protein
MDSPTALAVKAVQFGDAAALRSLLESRQVSAQATDGDGCSLLHWAAINNRVEIAGELLRHGARVSCAGGVLAEAPLHWAVRRGYGRMAALLIASGADLSYKSDAGQDALHLACRLSLKDMVFLLLSRGANPESIDGDEETPLVHCLKNQPTVSIVRLLIRFHADVTVQDSDGNNCFHILLNHGASPEVIMLNDLLLAGAIDKIFAKNNAGNNAFQLAWKMKNMMLVRYLWDAMIYATVPTWFGPVSMFLSVVIVPVLLNHYGWLWGSVLLFVIETFVFDKISMPNVFYGNISSNFYIASGVATALFASYVVYVHSYVSSFSNALMMAGGAAVVYVWFLCMTTKPKTISAGSKDVVIARLIESAPADGPAEDCRGVAADTAGGDPTWSDDVEASKPLIARIDEHEKEEFCLCSSCLADKCGAHHCNRCQACIVDMDYHCLVTMNCVGAGNGRVHFLFVVLVFCVCLLYMFLAISVEHSVHCPNSQGMLWNLFAVQVCIFRENPALAMTPLALFCILNYTANKIHMIVTSIALETTKLDLSRKRNRVASTQYMTVAEIGQKVIKYLMTGSHPILRRSLKEVEAEELRIIQEEAKLEAEKEALREKHTGKGRYREGSFDNGDSSAKKGLDPLNTMGRIDR